jgi:hypothetical protein
VRAIPANAKGDFPMALTLTLERTVLNNVDDPAGCWQFEGGRVFEEKRDVGFYASTKRVVFGATDAQNTAMLTLEVFFLPQNIVLQGSHDFNSGEEIGSVSAASCRNDRLTDRNVRLRARHGSFWLDGTVIGYVRGTSEGSKAIYRRDAECAEGSINRRL